MTETETAWAARVAEWHSSGESAKDFCARIGFSVSTLRWWSSHLGRRIANQPAAAEAAAPVLARVEVRRPATAPAAVASAMRIVVDGVHVDVERGFDPELLRAVIAALRPESR